MICINEIIVTKPCKQPVHAFGINCIQPIDGDTDIVNQANPFIPDLSYRSENYVHRAYRYILKNQATSC